MAQCLLPSNVRIAQFVAARFMRPTEAPKPSLFCSLVSYMPLGTIPALVLACASCVCSAVGPDSRHTGVIDPFLSIALNRWAPRDAAPA